MPRVTKENLQKENTDLVKRLANAEAMVDQQRNNDKRRREDFAKVLNVPQIREPYATRYETPDLSWNEIFFKVGELSGEVRYTKLIDDLKELKIKNESLKIRLAKGPISYGSDKPNK